MLTICETEFESGHAQLLLQWFHKAWPELSFFEHEKNGVEVPKPLIAIDDGTLIGGLSFCGYSGLDGEATAIWINAVFVLLEKRKLGVASHLIRAAQDKIPKLYALTDIPKLYTNLGWRIVSQGKDGTTQLRSW